MWEERKNTQLLRSIDAIASRISEVSQQGHGSFVFLQRSNSLVPLCLQVRQLHVAEGPEVCQGEALV